MSCFTPILAFRTKDGISFHQNSDENLYEIKLPCGKCVGCRMEYARQWAVRCVHEASLHEKNCFLTLTLSDENLNKNLSLDKTDYQLFMKRLRKKFPRRTYGKIGYYMCGEYGENYFRPHYHACLFNFDFPDKLEIENSKTGHRQFTSKILDEIWQNGRATIGDVTPESASYVARYVTKKLQNNQKDSIYSNRLPEYTTCSRRPAVGLNWIEKYHTDIYNYDVLIKDGKKMRPPRYYDKFYEKNFPEKFLDVRCKREESSSIQSLSIENTKERINVKHKMSLIHLRQKGNRSLTEQSLAEVRHLEQTYDERAISYRENGIQLAKNDTPEIERRIKSLEDTRKTNGEINRPTGEIT
ncbi:MAG: replication initiator protein [Arizlama microvirus]|nr:MAG: replication initiator protein [Arizlama microvirus]